MFTQTLLKDAILAFVLGFLIGYIIVYCLDSNATPVVIRTKKVQGVTCTYNSTRIPGSALETGWYCK